MRRRRRPRRKSNKFLFRRLERLNDLTYLHTCLCKIEMNFRAYAEGMIHTLLK